MNDTATAPFPEPNIVRKCTVSWKHKVTKAKVVCDYPMDDASACPYHRRGGDAIHKAREQRDEQKRNMIGEAIEYMRDHPDSSLAGDPIAFVAHHLAHAGIHATADEIAAALAPVSAA